MVIERTESSPNLNMFQPAKTLMGLSPISEGVVLALAYTGLFQYPLTREEVHARLVLPNINAAEVHSALDDLVAAKQVFQFGEFYSLDNAPQQEEKRRKGNQMARDKMSKAHRVSRLIFSFPYVRVVSLSGSLSKDYMDETTDIDFFIITKPKRLWLCRTLLIAYKKIFLLNSYQHFCLNYFIDLDHLEVEERNLFTATEVVTLVPTCGSKGFQAFLSANEWYRNHYPNGSARSADGVVADRPKGLKRLLEGILNTPIGDALDSYCMRITVGHWKKKFTEFRPEDFDVAMKSRSYVSKHHPGNFQRRVLDAYVQRVKQFEREHGLSISMAYE